MMDRMSSRKSREFTADKPLVIEVVQRGTSWTIQPGSSDIAAMKGRLNDLEPNGKHLQDRIQNEWTARNGKTLSPPFLSDPEHIPIIIREGEFVQFVCDPALPFDIWVQKNSDVAGVAGTPIDPFGWNGAHQSVVAGGSLTAAVTIPPVDGNGDPTQPGPRDQGFYKFHAIVYQAGLRIPVDPDGYCDR